MSLKVNSYSPRLLSSCTDEYAHTYDISTYWVSSDRHRRRQPYSRGSTCCPIICTGPAPNVKCCPIFGMGLNINCHEIINYKWFILTSHAAQCARSSCIHSDTLHSIQVIPGRRLRYVIISRVVSRKRRKNKNAEWLRCTRKKNGKDLPLLFQMHKTWSVDSQQNYYKMLSYRRETALQRAL